MMTETSSEDLIRARAYRLWEAGGRRDGEHEQHWRQAASELAGEMPAAAPRTKGARKAPAKKSAAAMKKLS